MSMMSKKKYLIKTRYGKFFAKIWYDKKDTAYLASVPHLPEIVTFGKTLSDAKRMVKDAIELGCACALDGEKVVI